MRSGFKTFALFSVALSIIGFVDLTPVQFGRVFSAVAEASEWSEGTLMVVNRPAHKEGPEESVGPAELRMDNGSIIPLDPKAKLRDAKGDSIELDRFTSPSKIRFKLEKGVVKEMVLIEALPR
jgi:hypothetical protein